MSFSKQPYKIDSIIISILQMKKQACKVQTISQNHTPRKQRNWDSIPESSDSWALELTSSAWTDIANGITSVLLEKCFIWMNLNIYFNLT